jgi:hypothetical protein
LTISSPSLAVRLALITFAPCFASVSVIDMPTKGELSVRDPFVDRETESWIQTSAGAAGNKDCTTLDFVHVPEIK